jgi:hypothetical protein
MELWQKIIEAYPELTPTSPFQDLGIYLKDDSDGQGAYIEKWEYKEPLADGFKLGK